MARANPRVSRPGTCSHGMPWRITLVWVLSVAALVLLTRWSYQCLGSGLCRIDRLSQRVEYYDMLREEWSDQLAPVDAPERKHASDLGRRPKLSYEGLAGESGASGSVESVDPEARTVKIRMRPGQPVRIGDELGIMRGEDIICSAVVVGVRECAVTGYIIHRAEAQEPHTGDQVLRR